ncbi:MAG: hypothetical protein H2184_11490 [Candidatus Galacturonibacter soehngenii]|nr:hypothetical protein [Candidatus Galacturonibacter soehngenii]
MANKKLGKFLAFTAIAGAAIAAGIAYFKHKNDAEYFDEDLDDLDEDFDDEDFDFPLTTEDENNAVKREYVSLNLDKETDDTADSSEVKEEDATSVSEADSNTAQESNDPSTL